MGDGVSTGGGPIPEQYSEVNPYEHEDSLRPPAPEALHKMRVEGTIASDEQAERADQRSALVASGGFVVAMAGVMVEQKTVHSGLFAAGIGGIFYGLAKQVRISAYYTRKNR